MANFQIATWYDTWNETGYNNLKNGDVPLNYATRYNLAFGELVKSGSDGYTVSMNAQYAADVKSEISTQAPHVEIYAGLGSTGISETVSDNSNNNNRSTANIVSWLQDNGYDGICIDAEEYTAMQDVPTLVTQLGPSFKSAGLGIAVSVPWPGNGPKELYGDNTVEAFNAHVDYLEFQDYSSAGTPSDVPVWTEKGTKASIIMGGVCTENSDVQTSLKDTASWTTYALENNLGGMFSWRLDNDHGTHGKEEDVDPTFTGAKTVYDTVQNYQG